MPVKSVLDKALLFGKSFVQSIKEFSEEHSFTYGAALAYYSIFAIVPTLYLAVTLSGIIFGEEQLYQMLYDALNETAGSQSADEMTTIVRNLNILNSSILMNVISILVLLYSTSAIFWSIKSSLHLMWGLKPEVRSKLLKTIIDRFMSLVMLFIIGLLISLVFLSETLFVILAERLQVEGMQEVSYGVYVIEHSVGVLLYTIVFILIFKYLPDAQIRWRTVIVGAFFTGGLFYVGTYLVSWYLSIVPFTNRLGAAGPILILLLWVYYSSQIVFLGAKFTHVWSQKTGYPIEDYNYRFLKKAKKGDE